jgi:formylglycine-generating enzyme required for sulfatase activity
VVLAMPVVLTYLRPPSLALLCLCTLFTLITSTQAAANRDAIAVIIGNKTYQHQDVPAVDFAHNDAEAMKRFVIDVLGYRERNIIDLRDATQAQLTSTFGKEGNHKGKLWSYVKEGKSDVTVFYSGHGVPGLKDQRGYLLPVNADPATVDLNGYPVDVLYENLSKLPAKSVTVYLDACFSGQTPKGALVRATSGLLVEPRPPKASTRLTVLTAARGDQVASWDEEAKLGLFTRYLLEALQGAADKGEFGDGDGTVSVGEVKRYLDEEMSYAAKRRYRRTQTATVMGDEGVQLAALVAPAITTQPERMAPVVEIEEMDVTYVTLKTANLRAGPGTSHEKVGRAATDSALAVTGRVKGTKWLRVAHAGGSAFVFAPLANEIDPAELASWRELGPAPGRVKLEAHLKSFGDGHFAERVQAMLAALPKPEPEPAYRVTALSKIMRAVEGVIIRRKPDGLSKSIARISGGEEVEVVGLVARQKWNKTGHRWYKVALSGNRSGFAFGRALVERKKVEAPTPTPKAQPVVGVYPNPDPVVEKTRYKPGDVFKDCDVCPEMVVVPAGEFMMGSNEGNRDEKPVHTVTISNAFVVGVYEITISEWDSCVAEGQCPAPRPSGKKLDFSTASTPVSRIGFKNAQQYVSWLSQKTKQRYRIPSESEWEYFARAGSHYSYSFGEIIEPEHANYAVDLFRPVEVGRYKPNKFGLYDVHGNVREWTSDCYRRDYNGAPTDGASNGLGNCWARVSRGGSWNDDPHNIRSAKRFKESGINARYNGLTGLRVVRDLD